MMLDEQTRKQVAETLDSAFINGAFKSDGPLRGASSDKIANDLATYDADLSGCNLAELKWYVVEWLDENSVYITGTSQVM